MNILFESSISQGSIQRPNKSTPEPQGSTHGSNPKLGAPYKREPTKLTEQQAKQLNTTKPKRMASTRDVHTTKIKSSTQKVKYTKPGTAKGGRETQPRAGAGGEDASVHSSWRGSLDHNHDHTQNDRGHQNEV